MRTGLLGVVLLGALGWLVSVSAAAGGGARDLPFGVDAHGRPTGGWVVPTPGFGVTVEGGAARLSPVEGRVGFGNLMVMMTDIDAWRGRRIALTARVRVEGDAGRGQAWVRVDRPEGRRGFFENMHGDPVLPGDWRAVRIEGDVHDDAAAVSLGFMLIGADAGTALLVDSVRVEVVGDARSVQAASGSRALSERELANAAAAARAFALVWLFDPGDAARGTESWAHVAVDVMDAALGATDGAELAERIGAALAPVSPALRVWAGAREDAGALPDIAEGATLARFWRHRGAGRAQAGGDAGVYRSFLDAVSLEDEDALERRAEAFWVEELAEGVWCRLPLWADMVGGRTAPASADAGRYASAESLPELTSASILTRLAGVAMAWGVLEHFYPYFDTVGEWDGALTGALADAAEAGDARAYERALRRLVARLGDGHGTVERSGRVAQRYLPVRPAWAGDELVVVGRVEGVRDRIEIGDVIESIDGRSAMAWLDEARGEISAATEGWLRFRSGMWFVMDLPTPERFEMVVRSPGGEARVLTVERSVNWAEDEAWGGWGKAPENGSELAPGIVYFNLVGAEESEFERYLDVLAGSEGIVFDMRGYPDSAAFRLMSHLTDGPVRSARWMIPEVTRPGRAGWAWGEPGRWLIQPRAPRLTAETVFLVSEGAISYAESIMGIVEHEEMGTIVGTPTAGTNGNVHEIMLPDGFHVMWTGMKVLKHDGSRHHGVGIVPEVEARPTPAGIAAGRDEVLEHGVQVLRAKLAAARENGPP